MTTTPSQLAAAVIYQALEDTLSNNSARAEDAKSFLFSEDEDSRTALCWWLDMLGLRPVSIEELKTLSQEQLKERLSYASGKRRRQ